MKPTFTLWVKHAKGPRFWNPMITGLTQQLAVEEMLVRQDRVRRSKEPCRFVVLPDGEKPSGG